MAKEKENFTGIVKSITKDAKDDKHYYDYEMGKKFYRWKVLFEEDDVLRYVRKLEENGPQPLKPGDRIKAQSEEKTKDDRTRIVLTKVELIDANGNPLTPAGPSGSSKSTWNDPSVTGPKFYSESLRRVLRMLWKLNEWTEEFSAMPADERDPFHLMAVNDKALQIMANSIQAYVTKDGTDLNRDSVEIRFSCLDNAISCMDLPSYTHLKGNDEETDPTTGRLVVKKRLITKLIEQAEIFLVYVNQKPS